MNEPDLDFGQTIRGFAEGQKVFGRHALRKVLGRGGMGIVWLAWDEKLEREIALKFLPEMVRLDATAVDELKRETRKSLSLTHANIVRIHDFVDDSQSAAIAMEYIDGATLSALRVQKPGRVFEVEELRDWVGQICQALTYAHEEARVVHRDLKPANLMKTSAGRIKITDFGIARSICDSASRMTVGVGNSSGTLVYMSPQQMDGEDPSTSDDIYSFGVTLYELLTSRPPFTSGNIYAQVKDKVPPALRDRRSALSLNGQPIPTSWETTIAACMAKDPRQRPQSMRDVVSGLERSLPPPAPESPPIVDPPPPPLSRRFSRSFVIMAASLVIVLGGGGALWLGWQWNERRKTNAQTNELSRVQETMEQKLRIE
jgi:serine/threonine protein kinase